jgi:hypothetical protein
MPRRPRTDPGIKLVVKTKKKNCSLYAVVSTRTAITAANLSALRQLSFCWKLTSRRHYKPGLFPISCYTNRSNVSDFSSLSYFGFVFLLTRIPLLIYSNFLLIYTNTGLRNYIDYNEHSDFNKKLKLQCCK